MASRVLGLSLQYIGTDASEKRDWTSASDTPSIDQGSVNLRPNFMIR